MRSNPDTIASVLASMGRQAAAMPPSWDGARCTSLASSPDGKVFGQMLPGRGLVLGHDLKALGITKPLPHVYERSRVGRMLDYVATKAPEWQGRVYYDRRLQKIVRPHPEVLAVKAAAMLAAVGLPGIDPISAPLLAGAITTYDGIINARANGKANDVALSKATLTTVASQWFDLFRQGGLPTAGAYLATTAPTQEVKTRASAGAWSVGLTNPSGTDLKYLLTFGFTAANTINMAMLVDILSAGGAFRLTVTSAETVASPVALTRNTGGAGNLMCGVATTATSATSHVLTVTYVDQDNNSSTTTYTNAAVVAASGIYPVSAQPFIPFTNGDYGLRSLSQTQSSVALAAGVLAMLIYYPMAFVPGITGNVYAERDSTVQIDGLKEILQDGSDVLGCLNLFVLANTTSTGILTAFMRSCDG